MLIHGGKNLSNKTLNDTLIIEYDFLKISKLDLRGSKSPYLSGHCSELILENEKFLVGDYSIYKGGLYESQNILHKILYEGVYVFCGIYEHDNYSNEVYCLQIGKRPCNWVHLKIGGIAPHPRIYAKMNFYSAMKLLIIISSLR